MGTLKDRDGVRHLALQDNDDEAWWTPIACGEGICLPGPQTDDPVDCSDCLAIGDGERDASR